MKQILLIDDDRELCALLREYLEPEGFACTVVHNGVDGLARAIEDNWDIVILDVMLPGKTGFQVLAALRGREAPVPVLMLTARGDDVDRVIGLEMGADDYLPKPFNPRELVARMRAILRRTAGLGGTNADGSAVSGDCTRILSVGGSAYGLHASQGNCGRSERGADRGGISVVATAAGDSGGPCRARDAFPTGFGERFQTI